MTLECKSTDGVNEDISSRIRSLLLSRNHKRPPQTPCTSEEQPRGPLLDAGLANSDCPTIISLSTSGIGLPSELQLLEKIGSLPKSADMANDRKPSTSETTVIHVSPALQTSSSVNDFRASIADARYHEQKFTCCTPHILHATNDESWLPHLKLRNMKMVSTNPISCLDTGTQIPTNDAEIHADELDCCPPCEPDRNTHSRYIVNRTTLHGKQLKAEPIDLLKDVSPPDKPTIQVITANSPPVVTDIRDNDFRQPYSPLKSLHGSQSLDRIRNSFPLRFPEELSKNQRRLLRQNGSSTKGLSPRSSSTSNDKFPHVVQSLAAATTETQPYSTIINTNFSFPGAKIQSTPKDLQNSIISRRLSKAHPDSTSNPLHSSTPSGTEKGEFSKPDSSPSNGRFGPKESSISAKSSHGSLKPRKPQSVSLLSGASRASAYQHSLLKTSISDSQPVEVGLPLPPLLTSVTRTPIVPPSDNTARGSDEVLTGFKYEAEEGDQRVKIVIEKDRSPPLQNLTLAYKETEQITIRDEENLALRLSSPELSKTKVVLPARNSSKVKYFPQKESKIFLGSEQSVGKEAFNNPFSGFPASLTPKETSHIDCIDFVPEIKYSLQDAIQLAIRRTIKDLSIPFGTSPVNAARAYRRLVAESLTEAAEDVDNCLPRTSFWENRDRSQETTYTGKWREREANGSRQNDNKKRKLQDNRTEPMKEKLAADRHEPTIKTHSPDSSRYSLSLFKESKIAEKSINFRGNIETKESAENPQSTMSPIVKKFGSLVNEDSPPENYWKLRTISSAFKRGSCAVIPNRRSSRTRVLSPKYCGRNTPNQNSSKRREVVSHRQPAKFDLPRVSRAVQSESSVGSRNVPCSDEDYQSEQILNLKNQHDSGEIGLLLNIIPSQRLSRKNTVHWLQDFLSGNGPYKSQLTDIPKRKRQEEGFSNTKQRSKFVPGRPVTQSILTKLPNVFNIDVDAQELSDPICGDDKASASETFTKTINELENLLNEALVIARVAAERNFEDESRRPPKSEAEMSVGCSIELEEDVELGSCSESSDSADTESGDFSNKSVCDQIRDTAITIPRISESSRRPSGWPPSGRGPTPYPPKSIPPSRESIFEDIQLLERIGSAIKETELIKGTDPRSNPPETNLPSTSPQRVFVPLVEFQTNEPSKIKKEIFNKAERLKRFLRPISPKNKFHKSRPGITIDQVDSEAEVEFRRPRPPIQPRASSRALKHQAELAQPRANSQGNSSSGILIRDQTFVWQDIGQRQSKPCSQVKHENAASAMDLRPEQLRYSCSLDGSQVTHSEEVDFKHGYGHRQHGNENIADISTVQETEIVELRDVFSPNLPVTNISSRTKQQEQQINLKNKRHVSLRDHKGFSLTRSHKRQAIARDWSPGRKRFCAAVACISTALVGILVGIYAGETPAIQYWIVDFHHYTVLGNVFFFVGLSVPSFLFWPLPLLHGRKPYILSAMSLAMPLLFPQAVAVGQFRSPYVSIWRVSLILPRALMGFCLGFANMNFKSILTDLFGASLQSDRPHQEHVDEFDVRRHGGGLGVWLGLWTWSAMGSIGLGFLIGAVIINGLQPVWGFYISITIIAFVLLLNVLTPEVRRSAYRRSVAEVKNGEQVSRRLARGEVKMHLVQTGPKWWGEEFHYGLLLSLKMLKQPGFTVMALYVAWMYGQIVLIVLLLGSLCSNSYRFKSHEVGAAVAVVPLGALIAIPFQKASLFSRDRNHDPTSDDDTYKKKIKWSSHLVRRAIFVLTLPFAGLAYTLSARGPPIPFILPILFAGLIAFLSNLAMAECHGIMMETYDTSDLQPGMSGRSRGSAGDKPASKRTNYSSFPRVASAFAITQGLGYLIAAAASGVGGSLTRNFGQQAASGIMAFILLILSLMLLGVLVRFKDVQIIPNTKKEEMEQYHNARRASAIRRSQGINELEPWRPIIIGNPHHSTRRMCILELGNMSRFSEIRRKNRLVDEQSLEARHPNQQIMMDLKLKIKQKELQVVEQVWRSLSRGSSQGSRRSKFSSGEGEYRNQEQGDLGGHTEMGKMHSENLSGRRTTTNIPE